MADTVTLPKELIERLTKWRLCMSYNDSYFGEPAGELKRITHEIEHALESRVLAERKQEPVAWKVVMEGQRGERQTVILESLKDAKNISDFGDPVPLFAHPTPDDASQWISVKDRLPDDGQAVMFVVASKYPDYNGRVLGGSFCMLAGVPSFNTPGVGYRASHWMPLPKPPAAIDRARQDKEGS